MLHGCLRSNINDAIVWDPYYKPPWMDKFDGSVQREMRSNLSDPSTIRANGDIREYCLHLAANCDIFILYLDGTFTVGALEELAVAKYKPIFVISDDIPSMWLVDQLDAYNCSDFVFHDTIFDLVNLLLKVDNGTIDLQKVMGINLFKWMFMLNGGDYATSDD